MSEARTRSAARSALRVGGAGVARLDRRPRGRRVLLAAIPRLLPRWFDSSAARDLEATFELRVGNSSAAELQCFAVTISDQRCTVSAGPAQRPGATVTIGAEDVVRVASGAVGWPELLSTGKLVLSGDPFQALRFPALFRLPVNRSA